MLVINYIKNDTVSRLEQHLRVHLLLLLLYQGHGQSNVENTIKFAIKDLLRSILGQIT